LYHTHAIHGLTNRSILCTDICF